MDRRPADGSETVGAKRAASRAAVMPPLHHGNVAIAWSRKARRAISRTGRRVPGLVRALFQRPHEGVGDARRLERDQRGMGRAALRRDPFALHVEAFLAAQRQRRRAGEGRQRELPTLFGAEPHRDSSAHHRLGDIEHVGRPGAGQRGDRVEIGLAIDPEHAAGRRQHRLDLGATARGDRAARIQARDALADQRRRVRHRPHHALAAGRLRDRIAADAGHHAEVQRVGDERRGRRGGAAESLRLDGPDHERRVAKRRVGGGEHPHAEVARQSLALRRFRIDDDDRGRLAAAAAQAADDRAGHVAAPDECGGTHGASVRSELQARHHRMRLHVPAATPCTSKAPAIAAPCASASKRTAPCRSCTATARSAARRRAAVATRSTSAARRRR